MRCKITNQNIESLTLPAPLTGALGPLGIAVVPYTVDQITALFGGAAGVVAARIGLEEVPANAELTSQGGTGGTGLLLTADSAGRAVMADGYLDEATVDAKVVAGAIDSDRLKPASVVGTQLATLANAAVILGVPGIIRIDIVDASADTDVVMTHKVRVLDAWFRSSGIAAHAANDTVQLKNGANAITDAVAKTATVNSVKRASTISPTYEEIAAGGTLRVTAVKDTNVAGTMYVLAVRVP